MDLYVSGNSPLIQPRPCPRWFTDKPNECNHVPSGEVDAASPDVHSKACPLLASSPQLVLRDEQNISFKQTEAETVIVLHDKSGQQFVHSRDGHDRTVEEGTLPHLLQHVQNEDQQDLWQDYKLPSPNDNDDNDELGDELFGAEYPRGSVVELGLLSRNGAIYSIRQEPFQIQELTAPEVRRPFLHALFRQECNNRERDVWPAVVFAEQPAVVYRTRTVDELVYWLSGKEVRVNCICLPSPVATLSTSRGRAVHCVAITEDGGVYHWRRDYENAGSVHSTTLQAASSSSPNSMVAPQHIDIPPTSKVALGLNLGAAVTRNGALYAFSLNTPRRNTAHIADLDDGTPKHKVCGLFVPRLASISKDDNHFVDVAAGDDHLVALTTDGGVFTVGSGFQGALGIGEKQFHLDDSESGHDAVEFAEEWQEVALPGEIAASGKKVVGVAAGFQSTMLVVGTA
jgi:alpha-tubulin suppressor-like RCC1 family protein